MSGRPSYDNFYEDEDLFNEIFPDFPRHQEVAAKRIWSRVLARCGVDPGMPPIKFIVDLGCGKGNFAAALTTMAAAARKNDSKKPEIITFGIDCSPAGIKAAQGLGSACKFFDWDQSVEESFKMLEVKYGVEWENTALLCMGHTWFHFNQLEILSSIKKYRPAVLLIDVFASWDETVSKIIQHGHKEVLEEGRAASKPGAFYFLKTTPLEGQPDMVRRGIWKVWHSGDKPRGDWLLKDTGFPTHQYACLTSTLFGKPMSAADQSLRPPEDVLRQSRTQGLITGYGESPDHCDYIPRKELSHNSGWGRMRCHVFVPRDPSAIMVNQAYFETIRHVVRSLFIDHEGEDPNGHLRKMLELFNDARRASAVALEGSREAAIVLPFDPNTTFARMVGLFKDQWENEIQNHDLILERPNPVQNRFPTASGAFHTLEDRVSSPQAFPLDWATDYDHSEADKEFAKLENALLGLSPDQKEDDTLGYFVLPIYFGSLPLFSLLLRYPALFNVNSTSFHVYFSALTNLQTAVKVALTDVYIEFQIIRPWIAATLENRISRSHGEEAARDPVARHLAMIEAMLFGKPGSQQDEIGTEESLIERKGGVLNKDWKSWAMGIPSYPIKNLRLVQAENRRLARIWVAERRYFQLEHALRLSIWFEEARFFEDDHDCFVPVTHLASLNTMLQRVGLAEGLTGIKTLISRDESDAGWRQARAYFSSSADHFLFWWMSETLSKIVTGTTAEQQGAYLDLKAVFCKLLANTGSNIRFGCRRLYCLLEAARMKPLEGDKPDCLTMKGFDAQCAGPDDPSQDLAAFVHLLATFKPNDLNFLETVYFKSTRKGQSACIHVQVGIDKMIYDTDVMGGKGCKPLKIVFDRIGRFEKDGALCDRRVFEFTLNVTVGDGKVSFRGPRDEICN